MSDKLFKEIELKEGALVQFVGCYITRWPYNIMQPTIGFTEIDQDDIESQLAAAERERDAACKLFEEMTIKCEAAIAYTERLAQALEPFAKFADNWNKSSPRSPDDTEIFVPLGHCRAARAALDAKGDK